MGWLQALLRISCYFQLDFPKGILISIDPFIVRFTWAGGLSILSRYGLDFHTMNLQLFKASVDDNQRLEGLSPALQSLWHQARGDWDAAHQLAQSDNSPTGYWIHAYLHRVEGDNGNAAYWYRLAGKPVCTSKLTEEWEEIVSALLMADE